MTDNPPSKVHAQRIAIVLPSLEGGGAERSMLNLSGAFVAQGRQVDLVLCQAKGAYMGQIPSGVRVIELKGAGELAGRWLAAKVNRENFSAMLRPVLLAKKNAPEVARIRSLQQYMDEHRPDVILSALTYTNLATLWAKKLSNCQAPVVVSERNMLSTQCTRPERFRKWRWRHLPQLVHLNYPAAAAVVAVSRQVEDELVDPIGLDREQITTLYNPVVDDNLRSGAREELQHPWFDGDGPPVILGVGRLAMQKDFATLIRAFARLRRQRKARLLILGEGSERNALQKLAGELGVQDDVDLAGFVSNPFAYMARASVLVLSSEYEGLPGVLIQAMACGCPVISTNCPGGSAEILENGRFGALVKVRDDAGMAEAILAELDSPTPANDLLTRAEDFSVETAAGSYLALLDKLFQDRGKLFFTPQPHP